MFELAVPESSFFTSLAESRREWGGTYWSLQLRECKESPGGSSEKLPPGNEH
jgi:hypothetical protein